MPKAISHKDFCKGDDPKWRFFQEQPNLILTKGKKSQSGAHHSPFRLRSQSTKGPSGSEYLRQRSKATSRGANRQSKGKTASTPVKTPAGLLTTIISKETTKRRPKKEERSAQGFKELGKTNAVLHIHAFQKFDFHIHHIMANLGRDIAPLLRGLEHHKPLVLLVHIALDELAIC